MRLLRDTTPRPKRKGFRTMPKKKAGPPPIGACVAHRCKAHENIRPLNLNTEEGCECAACVAADIQNVLTIYNEMRATLERACGALDLLSPGAGDPFRPTPIDEVPTDG